MKFPGRGVSFRGEETEFDNCKSDVDACKSNDVVAAELMYIFSCKFS